ncbi:MAG: CRISPR-associated helicase Cas3' [Spirochaetales bacterium]|nr:CRISPR-associated helicase Cas3' [Spirochaetales bacterium]
MAAVDKQITYYDFWGKSDTADWHPLVYHLLDVAGVGQVFLQQNEVFRAKMATLLHMSEVDLTRFICFFLALHDLGKFSSAFQGLRSDILSVLQPEATPLPYSLRHDSLGFLFFKKRCLKAFPRLSGLFVEKALFSQTILESEIPSILMSITTGHHGTPPRTSKGLPTHIHTFFADDDIAAALAFITDCHAMFIDQVPLLTTDRTESALKTHSFTLAGFAVLCDWLGSHRAYFSYGSESNYRNKKLPLREYWPLALACARKAVQASGLLPSRFQKHLGSQQLFPDFELTPLQQYVENVSIPQGAQLWILEDVTGAGKTEAAFILTGRIANQGQVDGCFIALPTMATANGMYRRTQAIYRKLYTLESQPSLVLAHSNARLDSGFRSTIVTETHPETGAYDTGKNPDLTAGALCSAWLADSAKKSLLAQIGVGTIDQALLGVLLARFQSLRLFGLSNKILVLDEIHAYDEYMNELICCLLTYLASNTTPVIMLSATIPAVLRQRFLEAYNSGLADPVAIGTESTAAPFPLVSCLSATGLMQSDFEEIKTRPTVRRTVEAHFLYAQNTVLSTISDVIDSGKCCCWILNTVSDAIAAYDLLHSVPGIDREKMHLFHARFAMGDRLRIESNVLDWFGKNSTALERNGRVLIATQVVEQSLDLDFDVLITDLAPIDLLIQRAGRLMRHSRDAHGNPISRPDERGTARLYIHAPEFTADPDAGWYRQKFRGGALVYGNHSQLWNTQRVLLEKQGFAMPDDARFLIEAVYGRGTVIPEGLKANQQYTERKQKQDLSAAVNNLIDLAAGYTWVNDAQWDDLRAPTRLGLPTTRVLLLRFAEDRLHLWHRGEYAFANSQLTLMEYMLAEELSVSDFSEWNVLLPGLLKNFRAQLPGKGDGLMLLPLECRAETQCWEGFAFATGQKKTKYIYTENTGLIKDKEWKPI